MENKICQSCGMPITSNEQLGTYKDGSINSDYVNTAITMVNSSIKLQWKNT